MHSAYIPKPTTSGNLMIRVGPCAVWHGAPGSPLVWAWLVS